METNAYLCIGTVFRYINRPYKKVNLWLIFSLFFDVLLEASYS